jgi:hypothetical protein
MAAKKKSNDIRTSWNDPANSAESKTGKAGRERAKKYGTPVGTTYAWQSATDSKKIDTRTTIKSSRGNKYEITETQNLRKMGPNKVVSKRPTIDPVVSPKKKVSKKKK